MKKQGVVVSALKNFFSILRHVWFLVLFLLIGFIILNDSDQAVDTITDVMTRTGSSQSFFLYASLTVFALTNWYCARVMLMLAEIVYVNPAAIMKINKWLPRILGLFAYSGLIFLLFTLRKNNLELLAHADSDDQLRDHTIKTLREINFHLLWTACWAAGYFIFVIVRRWHASDQRFMPVKKTVKGLATATKFSIVIILALIVTFIFLFCFRTSGSALARTIGAVNVIFFALSIYTILGMIVLYAQYRAQLPYALFLFVYIFWISYYNNNHQVRLIGDVTQVKNRPAISTAFKSWIETRATDSAKDYPVFIVAAEGGGIRAAFFTAYTLVKIDSVYPGFKNHIFAVSSVSGGSLGAALYCALTTDAEKNHYPIDSVSSRARRFLQQDFLAPLNSAFVYSDFVQKFLPYPINYLDRSQWLEDSWSNAYLEVTGSHSFEEPLFNLYENPKSSVPHLFANSTHVESGRKAIYSDLNINIDTTEYFNNDIDLAALAGRPVALRTVASMSARFPFLTPSATIQKNGKDIANFVDGGYADNSGLGTAVSITNILNTMKNSLKNCRYTVHVIELKNSADHKAAAAMTGIYETRTVLSAFYNSWDNDVNRVMKNAKSYFHFNKAGGEFISLNLNRNVGIMPLGWDLSELAYERISQQVEIMAKNNTEKIRVLLSE